MTPEMQARFDAAPTFQSCIGVDEANRQVVSDVSGFCVWEAMRTLLGEDPRCGRSKAVTIASQGVPDEVWRDGAAKNFLRFEAHKAYTHLQR